MSETIRIKWFIGKVTDKIEGEIKKRVIEAKNHLKQRVISNISIPVTRVGKIVTERSKPGEFPRADTTELLKTIMDNVDQPRKGVWDGNVGTPKDYGLRLELKMSRSFLVRSLREEVPRIRQIMTRPIT